jgi:hypothetical protein
MGSTLRSYQLNFKSLTRIIRRPRRTPRRQCISQQPFFFFFFFFKKTSINLAFDNKYRNYSLEGNNGRTSSCESSKKRSGVLSSRGRVRASSAMGEGAGQAANASHMRTNMFVLRSIDEDSVSASSWLTLAALTLAQMSRLATSRTSRTETTVRNLASARRKKPC